MNMTVEQVRARLRRGEALSEIARELPNIPELRLKVLEIVQWKQRKKGLEPQMLVRYTCCDRTGELMLNGLRTRLYQETKHCAKCAPRKQKVYNRGAASPAKADIDLHLWALKTWATPPSVAAGLVPLEAR
jgi:hypothetical protein